MEKPSSTRKAISSAGVMLLKYRAKDRTWLVQHNPCPVLLLLSPVTTNQPKTDHLCRCGIPSSDLIKEKWQGRGKQ